MHKSLHYNLAFSVIENKIFLKTVIKSMGLLAPPPGRIVFEK